MRDVDGVFARDDAANDDDLLADRGKNLPAVDDDEIIGATAIVAF